MLDRHPEWVKFLESLAIQPYNDWKFHFNVAKAIKTNVPAKSEYSETGDSYLIRRDDKTHFTVFKLSDFERKIINTLTALRKFPKHAEPALHQFLGQISDKIEVHSDLLEGGSSLEKKEGLSRLMLSIVPNKEDFTMGMLAQPLEGGKI